MALFRIQRATGASPPAARWPLALLIFDPEDGGATFLRNVSSQRATRRYIPEGSNIHVNFYLYPERHMSQEIRIRKRGWL
jgi:hypothetical protein